MIIKVGDRVKKGKLRGVVTFLHDRGGTIVPVSCRVRWDHLDFQVDATIADLTLILD